jgi:hypothetical protein
MAMYSVMAGDGSAFGPVDEVGLVQWARENRLNAASSIRCEGSGQIVQAGSLPFLAGVFGAPAALAPVQPPWMQLVPYNSPQARMHALGQFSVALVVLLDFVTMGIFPLIWFGLMHDKMPKIRGDDPSAGKAIGFMFIPFFNLYWVFFHYMRLCDRIAEQRALRGLPEGNLKGLAIAAIVVGFVPYIGWCVGGPVMWAIFFGMLQSRVNELVDLTVAQGLQQPA